MMPLRQRVQGRCEKLFWLLRLFTAQRNRFWFCLCWFARVCVVRYLVSLGVFLVFEFSEHHSPKTLEVWLPSVCSVGIFGVV